MEAVPLRFGREVEVRLTEDALKRADIELDDDEWLPVMASFVESKKLHFIVALPWVPEDDGDLSAEEETWFIPTVVLEKDIEAMRFRKMRGSLDDES